MEIYLSSETEGRADSLLLPIRNYDVRQAFGLTEKEEKVKNKSTVIYLAGETEERAVKCFREVMQVVDPMLDEIRARSYGNALRELGIFAVIMKESSYEERFKCIKKVRRGK